jgi:adenylate/nucleoside-diphosphate kinase
VAKKIFEGIDEIFINGNFFEVDEEKISTNIVELLTEARRLPEVVYVLKSEESKWLARNLDKKQIEK